MKILISILLGISLLFYSHISKAEEYSYPYDPNDPSRGSKLLMYAAERELELACKEETAGIKKQIARGYLPADFVCDPDQMWLKIIEDWKKNCASDSWCAKDPHLYVGLYMTLMAALLRLEILD
jgi:hypothetical protein